MNQGEFFAIGLIADAVGFWLIFSGNTALAIIGFLITIAVAVICPKLPP